MADNLKPRSGVITDGPDRAPTRAMLKAAGFTDEDLRRPIIGVAHTWIEIGPCNYHLRRLAAKVKEGIRAAGGTPMEFNTVSISDGISMGVEGMKCSLISREIIADSIELVARGNHFDALVWTFPGLHSTADRSRRDISATATLRFRTFSRRWVRMGAAESTPINSR